MVSFVPTWKLDATAVWGKGIDSWVCMYPLVGLKRGRRRGEILVTVSTGHRRRNFGGQLVVPRISSSLFLYMSYRPRCLPQLVVCSPLGRLAIVLGPRHVIEAWKGAAICLSKVTGSYKGEKQERSTRPGLACIVVSEIGWTSSSGLSSGQLAGSIAELHLPFVRLLDSFEIRSHLARGPKMMICRPLIGEGFGIPLPTYITLDIGSRRTR